MIKVIKNSRRLFLGFAGRPRPVVSKISFLLRSNKKAAGKGPRQRKQKETEERLYDGVHQGALCAACYD